MILKGPLLAKLYPGQARRFIDLDVLTTDADALQRSLMAVGFVEDPDPDQHLMDDHHHLEPIRWPAIPLKVEVHARASMPGRARKVPAEEILEASIPAGLGIDGVFAPAPLHHALILASHAWLHAPLTRVRDLIDIAAVSGEADAAELAENRHGVGDQPSLANHVRSDRVALLRGAADGASQNLGPASRRRAGTHGRRESSAALDVRLLGASGSCGSRRAADGAPRRACPRTR